MTNRKPRGVAHVFLSTLKILAGAVILADAAARPLYRPLVDRISRMRLLQALEARVAQLPRAAILVVFAVPFLIAEPLKILALVMMAAGAVVPGAILLIVSHLATFLLVERIYHAGREKLRSYGWFDWGMTQVESVRDALKKAGWEAVSFLRRRLSGLSGR